MQVKASLIDGQGLFTTSFIPVGGIILSEAAAIVKGLPSEPLAAKLFRSSVSEIAAHGAPAAFYDLWTHHETETRKSLYDRWNTNCFEIGGDVTTAEKGLFYVAARINHSHIPNAKWKYDDETKRLVVIALENIRARSEVTISYCCTSRDTRMLGYYSFKCKCPFCVWWVHPSQDELGQGWRGFPHQDCGRCSACTRVITKSFAAEQLDNNQRETTEVRLSLEHRGRRASARDLENHIKERGSDEVEENNYEHCNHNDYDCNEEDDVGTAAERHYFH